MILEMAKSLCPFHKGNTQPLAGHSLVSHTHYVGWPQSSMHTKDERTALVVGGWFRIPQNIAWKKWRFVYLPHLEVSLRSELRTVTSAYSAASYSVHVFSVYFVKRL